MDVLSRRCHKTLKYLDIESSKGVKDDTEGTSISKLSSLTSLSQLKSLEEVNLFDTNLRDESLATILLELPNLTHLIRGDFLCDALEWIDYWVRITKHFYDNFDDFILLFSMLIKSSINYCTDDIFRMSILIVYFS